MCCFFFFQAEDGIRDVAVTGVQTCALPISIDEEQWTVLVTPESCDVQPGKTVESADCFLKTSAEIFLGTINGTYTPSMTDLIRGKVKTNNPFLLQKFREIFG